MKKVLFLITSLLILGLIFSGCNGDLTNLTTPSPMETEGIVNLTKGEFDVECPAAPAVAGLLLEAVGVDNRWGTGKDGGNFIKEVANHMGPETYFDGVDKCDIEEYRLAVAKFLIDQGNGAEKVAELFEAELESVVYEGACDNTFGDYLGETLTLTFSNNVSIQYGDQYVWFEDAYRLGNNVHYMEYTAEGNQVTITVKGTFGDPRPEVGDFVTELDGIVDALEIPVKVPVSGVEVIAKTYNYQWGPGYPYGATEAVYAAAIVSTCGMEVWWYSDGTLITEGWYYDEYSIQSISGWNSGNPANWNEPVKYLFGKHFPSIALAWYNRVLIDVGDVPLLEDAETL